MPNTVRVKFNATVLLSSLWFQVLWFVAVVGREEMLLWLLIGALITFAYCAYDHVKKLKPIFAISSLGVLMDMLNWSSGVFSFPSPSFPIWLILLWLVFGWYAVQMKDLVNRTPKYLVLITVSLSGGLSYFAGHKLGAVEWTLGEVLTVPILLLEWFLLAYFVTILFHSRWGKL